MNIISQTKLSIKLKEKFKRLESDSSIALLLIIFVFYLVLRIAYAFYFGHAEFSGTDSESYNSYAYEILKSNQWLTNPDFPGNYRAPGYPIFLSLIYLLFGSHNYLAVYIIQSIISSLACFYIYKLGYQIFDKKIALLSFIWSGFYVNYLHYNGFIAREALVFLLMILLFYNLYQYFMETKEIKNIWIPVIIYAVLVHVDTRYIFFVPFFFILFITYLQPKRAIKKYALFVSMFLLLLIPWTLRNYYAYDGLVVINTRTLDLRKTGSDKHNYESGLINNIFNFGIIKKAIINKNYPTLEEREQIKKGNNFNKRKADEVNAIKEDIYPDSTFIGRKYYWLKEFWRPARFSYDYFPFPDARFQEKWSILHNISSLMCYGLLLPFAIYGFYKLIINKNKIWIFLLLPVFVQMLLHVLQWSRDRYRMPIDFIIIIVGAYGIYIIYENFIRQMRKGNE